VRIAVAAGLDERTFGTDAVQIVAAIRSAEDGQGVVVLMDLGSALLSAELALELLDEQTRAAVLLCPAPLVEGLIVAAVAAPGCERAAAQPHHRLRAGARLEPVEGRRPGRAARPPGRGVDLRQPGQGGAGARTDPGPTRLRRTGRSRTRCAADRDRDRDRAGTRSARHGPGS
jgi:dihydroxyacetone kinase DhaKLM complex PTS-EIIA-like component DhaM